MDPIKNEYAIFKNERPWDLFAVSFETKEQAVQVLKKYNLPANEFVIMHRKVFTVATPW